MLGRKGLGRKRPDLRRDCDEPLSFWILVVGAFQDGKDLIYEGIATGRVFASSAVIYLLDGKDLIYEGIATNPLPGYVFRRSMRNRRKRPDLRRDCDCSAWPFGLTHYPRRKRPDLRRDCDPRQYLLLNSNSSHRRKRPDLRRDCDSRTCSTDSSFPRTEKT